MIYRAILFVALTMIPVDASVAQSERAYVNVPPHGTLFKGKLYGFFGTPFETPKEKATIGVFEYNLCGIRLANPDVRKWEQYCLSSMLGYGLRHRVAHGCVWFMRDPMALCRLELDELPLFERSNPNHGKQYQAKYPQGIRQPLAPSSLNHAFYLILLFSKYTEFAPGALLMPDPKKVPGFGAVPTSGTSCKSYFLNAKTQEMEIWDSAFIWDEKQTRWEHKPLPRYAKIDQWIKDLDSANFQKRTKATAELEELGYPASPALEKFIASKPSAESLRRAQELLEKSMRPPQLGFADYNYEKLPSVFLEDFHFFLRKDDYYFVTESGKLYHAPPPKAGEKSRTMKALWEDAKRPIVAVIEDADKGKVWLFAKDKNAGAKLDLFFEMKDTIRPETFDPVKLRPVNVEGHAKTLLEYLPLISADSKK